jgi:hypothetical protein
MRIIRERCGLDNGATRCPAEARPPEEKPVGASTSVAGPAAMVIMPFSRVAFGRNQRVRETFLCRKRRSSATIAVVMQPWERECRETLCREVQTSCQDELCENHPFSVLFL